MHLGAMSVDQALTQPEKSLNNWRLVARDQWEVAGISTSDTGEWLVQR